MGVHCISKASPFPQVLKGLYEYSCVYTDSAHKCENVFLLVHECYFFATAVWELVIVNLPLKSNV